ncbi:hydroxymethylpyrimidine/phosphomethylpyrimidine kinase [Halomonas sp. McH1-25]|uniref:bifunctional hydroxymethylpyrimidine kinase/phosphomethylpyrimidine kinase n=1 Tax=unclassified Halomonas TaxID=2609666 RepID=UPI001EF607CC|nr:MULTISPECIES: hydroxymethylpyrimidine/phosphomethylpyrimidine kinase [unclassified Halomonas]MCG7599636.1 hydroxymethylpyrimidine/phosphomethylpyrimidine kinase [Halomonas sp. McH1-25]MCP1342556.1 hydroxymethylpyrimidine/phosphomethylpyrimidine kinase [Halomonas sp. FL8]MCP1361408.1 hydroxymethylpyrimidine/phosphomethylpyrimidine kinase [Halomonas sp. BBD45]MCP1364612.1 hydroxymethylpyrimidine/phosphomethylpyrimidine kinase [Halomonas sp. BBD48]
MHGAKLPVVLVLAGHDPTGGAGLVADAETVLACGGWPVTVPTSLTVQSTHDVFNVTPCAPDGIRDMAWALLDEFDVAAIKVGLIADEASLDAIEDVVRACPGIPLVIDPVLRAGGGKDLSTTALIDDFRHRLLPLVDILTPNRHELARLAGEDAGSDVDRVVALLSQGCQAVLVTGTDDPPPETPDDTVIHTLHTPETSRQWRWSRLPGQFHGSGCTLASAVATRLAVGESLVAACEQAQQFTWESLRHGWQPGTGQALPRRWRP